MTTIPDWGQPGLRRAITIDGRDLLWNPSSLTPGAQIMQFRYPTADGGGKLSHPYRGEGQPNQHRQYSFRLPWESLEDDDTEQVEQIAADGEEHTLCIWKREYLFYSCAVGQQVLYLPRRRLNAPRVLSRSTDDFPFIFEVEDSPGSNTWTERTVVYQTDVAIDDAVPDGEVWVSDTTQTMKTAPAFTDPTKVRIQFYPLFPVFVESITINYPESVVDQKELQLTEN